MYMRVFVVLLSSLEFHTFPSACHFPLANRILLSTPRVRPLLCAGVPSQIHNVLLLVQFLSYHLQAKLLVSLSRKLAVCLLYVYLHAHIWLTCATPDSVICNPFSCS